MTKVLILGCCGSGKSSLARILNDKLKIPVIHLDQEYWNAGWEETPKEIWNLKVAELVKRSSWIMDGNYGSSLSLRLPAADTIIYLDRSTFTCLRRVIKRIRKYKGTTRPDMVAGCPERWDWDFLHYVLTFNLVRRKALLSKISSFSKDKNVHVLKSDAQIQNFLSTINRQ